VCNKAVKWGQRGIACDNCDLWYHRACMSMTTDSYQRLANSSIAWLCKGCNTPNHCSIIYQSIQSDDNQFSSLSDIEFNNTSHASNLSNSLYNSFSTINSPLASSSSKQRITSNKPQLSNGSLRILNINLQSIRNIRCIAKSDNINRHWCHNRNRNLVEWFNLFFRSDTNWPIWC